MNGFTSGTQALQGRKVNHDPKPWLNGHGVRIVHGIEGLNRNSYDPRPEFDVPDNLILASFRGRLRYQETVKCPVPAVSLANIWLTDLYRYTWSHQHDIAEFNHARRVLAKLAAVYA